MKSLRTGAALLALLFLALYARPLYSQAQTLMFGSYSGAAKAVTVTSAGAVNVSISGGAGVVPCANGGTGLSSYAVGDLLYASATCTLSKLAGVATGQVLASGGVTTAPAWSATPFLSRLSLASSAVATSTIPLYVQYSQAHLQVQFENTSTAPGAYTDYIVKSGTTAAFVGASNQNYGAGALGSNRSWLDTGNISGAGWDYSAQGANGTHCWFTTSSYTKRACLDVSGLAFANGGWLSFAAGTGAADAGISRTGAAAFAIGNGSASDASGSLSMAALTVNSVVITSATTGVAGGYKIARGATAFDGSNPTTVATGLTSVVGCTATMRLTAALTTGTAFVTHAAPSGANVDFYAWVIAGTASTGTETFDWVCVGT